MPGLVNDAVFGNIHNFHELSAGKFSGPPRADVFGIAGDPENPKVKLSRDRYQQAHASRGIPVTPMGEMNGVADMTGVQMKMRSRADAKIDAAEFLARLGMDHPKIVGRRFMYGMGSEFYELEF
jgi:hypothetical protein